MTYYNRQVLFLSTAIYSNTYLVKQVILARHFMNKQFMQNISLDDICKEACISKFHFIRSFKKMYGITPYQYLTSLRIREAKVLLKMKIPVNDVCYSLGFDSPTSFTGLFKRMVGQTPTTFKA